MVQAFTLFIATLAASGASAAPLLYRRVAQTIEDSTKLWQEACNEAGGGDKCSSVAQAGQAALRNGAAVCAQQDAADSMFDLAKTLSQAALVDIESMTRQALIYAQQPADQAGGQQTPYCQISPRNSELGGYFPCQFASVDLTRFSGDQTGNLPLGVTQVTPPGSCPARSTPVPDGAQLSTLVQDPGKPLGNLVSKSTATSATTSQSTQSSTQPQRRSESKDVPATASLPFVSSPTATKLNGEITATRLERRSRRALGQVFSRNKDEDDDNGGDDNDGDDGDDNDGDSGEDKNANGGGGDAKGKGDAADPGAGGKGADAAAGGAGKAAGKAAEKADAGSKAAVPAAGKGADKAVDTGDGKKDAGAENGEKAGEKATGGAAKAKVAAKTGDGDGAEGKASKAATKVAEEGGGKGAGISNAKGKDGANKAAADDKAADDAGKGKAAKKAADDDGEDGEDDDPGAGNAEGAGDNAGKKALAGAKNAKDAGGSNETAET